MAHDLAATMWRRQRWLVRTLNSHDRMTRLWQQRVAPERLCSYAAVKPFAEARGGDVDSIDTRDRAQAEAIFGRTFPHIGIEDDPHGRPFRFRYERVDRGALTRTRLRVHGVVHTPGVYPDHVAIGRRRHGQVGIRYGAHELDTTQPYLRPPGASAARFENSDVELIIIQREAFVAIAGRYLEGSRRALIAPRPDRARAVSAAGVRFWHATADAVASALWADSTLSDALLEEFVVAAVLTTFDAPRRPAGDGVHR